MLAILPASLLCLAVWGSNCGLSGHLVAQQVRTISQLIMFVLELLSSWTL